VSVSRETLTGSVSRETLDRLDAFAALLLAWNRRINLISRVDEPAIWPRHIADSLQLAPLIPANITRAADFGSGAGFPGLILSIATGIPFELIEADHRKASFLREAARATQAPATIHARRIEAVQIAPVQLVTARALAPLSALLSFASPLLQAGGICLFPKGGTVQREIQEASRAWTMRIEQHISRTDPSGVILRISEVMRV